MKRIDAGTRRGDREPWMLAALGSTSNIGRRCPPHVSRVSRNETPGADERRAPFGEIGRGRPRP
jgi:hypothetical protein